MAKGQLGWPRGGSALWGKDPAGRILKKEFFQTTDNPTLQLLDGRQFIASALLPGAINLVLLQGGLFTKSPTNGNPITVVGGILTGSYPSTGTAPANTAAPVISGDTEVGSILSVTDGTWTGDPTPAYTYRWRRNGSPISLATNSTYTTVEADIGQTITCAVTATNIISAVTQVSSNSITPLAAPLFFGTKSTGSVSYPTSDDRVWAGKYVLSQAAELTTLKIWRPASSAAPELKGLIFADVAGTPGALLVSTATVAMPSGGPGFYSIPITGSLAAGTYWIAVVTGGGYFSFTGQATGDTLRGESYNYPAWNAAWPGGGSGYTGALSAYVEYTPGAPAETLTTFANATANSTLSNGNRTITRASGSNFANCSSTAPITEKTYIEFTLSGDGCSAGFWAETEALSESALPGQWWGRRGFSMNVGPWSASAYGAYGIGGEEVSFNFQTFGSAQSPPHRLHLAIDPTTRQVWIRLRTGGVLYPWSGGGDPAAGTSPAFTIGGTNPIYLSATADGGSVTLELPENYTDPAPAGFRSGAIE